MSCVQCSPSFGLAEAMEPSEMISMSLRGWGADGLWVPEEPTLRITLPELPGFNSGPVAT